jgi:altronate dehydratase small subunit
LSADATIPVAARRVKLPFALVSGVKLRLVQRMSAADNVATALRELLPGEVIEIDDVQVTVATRIPFGHKVALADIAPNEPVLKYGEAIGLAAGAIAAGQHVHTHNVESQRGRGDLKR